MAAPPGSNPLPSGTVTFLLTDIEGSSRLWEAHGAEMKAAVARHYGLLDAIVAEHDGARPVEQGEGDSVVAVFSRASDAVAAALAAQRALAREQWAGDVALTVRIALHTGEAQLPTSVRTPGPASSAAPACGRWPTAARC